MSYPVSKVGDTSDHGGAIVTSSSSFDIEGFQLHESVTYLPAHNMATTQLSAA